MIRAARGHLNPGPMRNSLDYVLAEATITTWKRFDEVAETTAVPGDILHKVPRYLLVHYFLCTYIGSEKYRT